MSGETIACCRRVDPHPSHLWTPEPRAIHGPKRCPGVPDVGRTSAALRVIQRTADKQGNVTMLRLAENLANDGELVRLAQEEGWDEAITEAEACGLLDKVFADEMRGRNPYRGVSDAQQAPP